MASWTIVDSSNPSPSDAALSDVTCIGAGDCWAVGQDGVSGQTVIEHNAATGWVIVSSPNPAGNQYAELTGVTCISAGDCWTVGAYVNSSNVEKTLVEHFNGSTWTVISSPNPSPDQNILQNVMCVHAGDCWAVGNSFTDVGVRALIEHYTGGVWVVVGKGLSHAFLSDVACLSALGDCWAVGNIFGACPTPGGPPNGCTLIEHNAGTGWVIVPSPNVPTAWADSLNGVTCVNASNCWAVGKYINGKATRSLTLTEHYDGIGWTIVPSANGLGPSSILSDVSCAPTSGCWAVGTRQGGLGGDRTLVEHNTGTGWTIVKSPNASRQDNLLSGVKCLDSHRCWAVGGYQRLEPTAGDTLVEQYR